MKKFFFLLTIIICVCACSNGTPNDFGGVVIPTVNDVKLEFFTTEPNYDEIEFSYYDNETDKFISQTIQFKYDNNGSPLPLIIKWDNFTYKYVRGEGYRNNFSSAELNFNLYVNDVLVYQEKSSGNSNAYARVVFDYTIK